jgi:hypothetical protein
VATLQRSLEHEKSEVENHKILVNAIKEELKKNKSKVEEKNREQVSLSSLLSHLEVTLH